VSITGTSAGTATLTITTTAATSAALALPKRNGVPWYAASGAALAGVLFFGIPARRRSWRTMLGMLVFLAALTGGVLTSGCGGSGGGGGGGRHRQSRYYSGNLYRDRNGHFRHYHRHWDGHTHRSVGNRLTGSVQSGFRSSVVVNACQFRCRSKNARGSES
jgi:hypothetical protein